MRQAERARAAEPRRGRATQAADAARARVKLMPRRAGARSAEQKVMLQHMRQPLRLHELFYGATITGERCVERPS